MRLSGKVALITGGARGMGAEEARLFAREGAKVVLGDVLEDEGRRTEEQIVEAGGEALFVRLDVTSEDDWRHAIETTVGRFGRLDVLVNNAGVGSRRRDDEGEGQWWDRVMEVNAKGVYLGTQYAVPEMKKAGGSIVNISSIYGIVGSHTGAAYHASKGAVRVFSKVAAIQYGGDGIRVNSVHPGFVETAMTERILSEPGVREDRISKTPLRKIGQPEDIAYGVLFLASDESSFMTGSELVIDGGYTAQ